MSAVNAIADALLFDMLSESPDIAASMGVRDVAGRALSNDTLTDFSDAGAARRNAVMARARDSIAALDRAAVAPEDRMTDEVIRYLVEEGMFWLFRGRKGADFPEMADPLNPVEGAPQILATLLLDDHVLASRADAEDYVTRLRRLPDALDEVIGIARTRSAEGYRTARVFLERTRTALVPMCEAAENPLLARLRDCTALFPALKTPLLHDAEKIVAESVAPAYRALCREIEAQAAEDAAPVGLWARPRGEEHYAFLLRAHTTTNLTPADVHALGLEEVAALSARIRARFAEAGIAAGTMAEMYGALQAGTASKPAGEDGRAALKAEADRIVADLTRGCTPLFDRLPQARCIIEPVPETLEASMGSHYTPPRAGGGRPGVFKINLKEALERPLWELPVLCRHEIMPGHHLQLALAQEMPELTPFRRTIVFTAYIEGWAKYAEALPEEQGLSDDPRVALCRMRGELYSTVNLVLDTGLNAMRWPFERAVAYFKDMTGASGTLAEHIAARSLFHPGQLCSYKIGMREMFALKGLLAKARGPAFRIQEFHDLALGEGALPLSLLRRRFDAAIHAT